MKLQIIVQSNAKQNEIADLIDGKLKVKIKAAPIEGKANKELIKFLAKIFNVTKSSVQIISGENNKLKTLEISGLSLEELKK